MIAIIVQPILGAIAYLLSLKTHSQTEFHSPHKWLGRGLFVLGLVTIGLGFDAISGGSVVVSTWMWVLYAILLLVSFVMVFYYEIMKNQRRKSDPIQMTNLGEVAGVGDSEPEFIELRTRAGEWPWKHHIIFVSYVVVKLALVAALIGGMIASFYARRGTIPSD